MYSPVVHYDPDDFITTPSGKALTISSICSQPLLQIHIYLLQNDLFTRV